MESVGESRRKSQYASKTMRDYPGCLITPREAQVLNLLTQGRNYKEIAAILGLNQRTVKCHVAKAANRLQVKLPHIRIKLALCWSWPIFRIGAGYEEPTPHLAADVINRDRLRAEESTGSNAAD